MKNAMRVGLVIIVCVVTLFVSANVMNRVLENHCNNVAEQMAIEYGLVKCGDGWVYPVEGTDYVVYVDSNNNPVLYEYVASVESQQ